VEANPGTQAAEGDAAEDTRKRHHHRRGYNHLAAQNPKRKSKRQFLREALLYAVALAAFGEFLKWISEDHSSSPPPQ
jgi:hypothetical protein